MNDKIYQFIFDEISNFLPANWTKLVVSLEHSEDAYAYSYSYSFYVKTDGKYINCYDLDTSEEKIDATFSRIKEKVFKERSKLAKDKRWTNMTMIVDNDGNIKTEFDYEETIDYQYMKAWKKKYLD